jgi:uncharacterized delta-60 repeat protein
MKQAFYYLKKGAFFVFILIVISPAETYSQVSEEWTKFFESEESFDLVNDITADNSGNIYITGYSSFDPDILTVKYNSSGDIIWAKNFNSLDNESDIGEAVAVDNSGNVYVAGSTRKGSGSESQDIILIKYNPDGDILWTRGFNGNADDFDLAADAALDNDGNIYITGESTDSSSDENITTIKYDPSGNQQWVKFYNGSGDNVDEARAIYVDGSDNIYVTGYSRNGPFTADGDLTTIKYNSSGQEQWVGIYDQDDEFDGGVSVVADAAGNVHAAGTTTSSSLNQDFVIVKYNSSGMEQWAKLYNGTGNSADNGVKVAVDNQQNVYVTGSSQATSTFGRNDIITLKYNSSGEVQFTKTYDAAGYGDNAADLEIDENANLYVSGSTQDTALAVRLDYITIKYSSAGEELWTIKYDGPDHTGDQAIGLALDGDNNVIVTGTSQSHITTVKYSQVTGLKNISSGIPQKFSLSKNYPNPFNPVTKIRFTIPQTSMVRFTIYDILGNEVGVFINEEKNPGEYEFELDAANLTSGIYFYQLEAGNFIETGKMSLIK